MNRFLVFVLLLLAGLGDTAAAMPALALGDPCIPAGGSARVEDRRPPLEAPGMPADAQWLGGTGDPMAVEVDSTSPDDGMGDSTPSADGSTASAEVKNTDGDLSGPNGEDQNGGVEGDCIEVQNCWTAVYKIVDKPGKKSTLKDPITGSSDSWEYPPTYKWASVYRCGPRHKVCPCP